MEADVICNANADRARWLRERQKGIGGSDAPAILNVPGCWGSQQQIYLDKTEGEISDEPMPPYVEFGHLCERFVLDKIAAEVCGTAQLDGNLYRSRERPWQLCTLDGLIREGSQVTPTEVKSTAYEEKYAGQVPDDVYAQVQHQIATLGVPAIYVGVVYRVSMNWNWKLIERSDEFIGDVLIPQEEEFWRLVTERDPVGLTVTASESCTKALAKLNGYNDELPPRELGAEADDWADEIVALREFIKEKTEEMDLLKNKLRAKIGDRSMGVMPSNRYFRYKEQHRKSFTVKANTTRPLLGPYGKEV